MGSSTEGPSGAARMRPLRPVQLFVATQGAPTNVPVAQSACGSCAKCGVSWPHRELGNKTEHNHFGLFRNYFGRMATTGNGLRSKSSC
eukprot:3991572-Pyramimonas_sp.AAC.1